MKLNLNNPVVFFDLETTGINITNDRIVELCYIKVYPNGNEESKSMRINPEVAKDLANTIKGCDFAGFNSNRFDVPMLVEEFLRAGIDIDIRKRKFIDVQNIYHKLERRTLSAAYKFYCGKDLENAHSALADTRATYEVLMAQLDHYPEDLKNDVAFLSDFSKMTDNVDFAGRMVYDENHDIVFNFGKYKGKKVADVLRTDPGYYSWILQGDFARNTKQILTQIRLDMNKA